MLIFGSLLVRSGNWKRSGGRGQPQGRRSLISAASRKRDLSARCVVFVILVTAIKIAMVIITTQMLLATIITEQ
jgi:hypothetical protein